METIKCYMSDGTPIEISVQAGELVLEKKQVYDTSHRPFIVIPLTFKLARRLAFALLEVGKAELGDVTICAQCFAKIAVACTRCGTRTCPRHRCPEHPVLHPI